MIFRLPITGKIDKNKLPEVIEKENEIVTPETEVEQHLVEAWRAVFTVEIGITNDIFEKGANSIGLIQMIMILNNFNWNLTIQDFYKFNTIKELANHISLSMKSPQSIGENI